jgi:intracellular multiplication protein IcmP
MRGGSGQQQQEGSLDFLWISGFIILLICAVWWLFSAEVVAFVFAVRTAEANVILFVINIFRHIYPIDPYALQQWIVFMQSADDSMVKLSTLGQVSEAIGYYVKYLSVFAGMFFVLFLTFVHTGARFITAYTMNSLFDKESETNWPFAISAMEEDLVKQNINEGPFALSKTPMRFAKDEDLLDITQAYGEYTVQLRKDKAQHVFALQMGQLWGSIDKLPVHVQVLFAIFAAKANQDTKSANAFLRQIAESSSQSNTLDFKGYRSLLYKHIRSRLVGVAISPHAYVLTVMASMLELARTDGVVASSEFLWLKMVDRPLWYMLNNVGRQTAFPEVSGPFGHWKVEKKLRRPLKTPMVGEAVEALDEALKQIVYKPENL